MNTNNNNILYFNSQLGCAQLSLLFLFIFIQCILYTHCVCMCEIIFSIQCLIDWPTVDQSMVSLFVCLYLIATIFFCGQSHYIYIYINISLQISYADMHNMHCIYWITPVWSACDFDLDWTWIYIYIKDIFENKINNSNGNVHCCIEQQQ